MNKIILIITIFFLIQNNSFSYNEYYLEKDFSTIKTDNIGNTLSIDKGYNFIISTIENIKEIKIPKQYLKDNKKINNKNTIYSIKLVNNYVYSSDINKSKILQKDIYLYIEPSEINFKITDIKIGDKIITRSDNFLQNDNFYDPIYYKPSILELFYNKDNIYIVYQGILGFFNCDKNNKTDINILYPKDDSYFYSSLAFINPTTFKGDINQIAESEKNIIITKIDNSGICSKNNIELNKSRQLLSKNLIFKSYIGKIDTFIKNTDNKKLENILNKIKKLPKSIKENSKYIYVLNYLENSIKLKLGYF